VVSHDKLQVEPVTGLVLEIAQHPKSDKMKVCQIDVATAGGIVQVVTTSLAVKEGMAVILAVKFGLLLLIISPSWRLNWHSSQASIADMLQLECYIMRVHFLHFFGGLLGCNTHNCFVCTMICSLYMNARSMHNRIT
jgi:hypothetical protein